LSDELRIPEGYFDRRVFRFAVLVLVFVFFAALVEDGFSFDRHVFIRCPVDSPSPCVNPLHACVNDSFFDYLCPVSDELRVELCGAGFCDQAFLMPGEVVGRAPSVLVRSFEGFVVFIVVWSFVANHLLYVYKKRRGCVS